MGGFLARAAAIAAFIYPARSLASAACPTVLTSSSYESVVVGAGYTAQLIVQGLQSPRGIIFDQAGALLVVEQGSGIRHIVFNTDRNDTCLTTTKTTTLVSQSDVSCGPCPQGYQHRC